jgi:hypothetical protein
MDDKKETKMFDVYEYEHLVKFGNVYEDVSNIYKTLVGILFEYKRTGGCKMIEKVFDNKYKCNEMIDKFYSNMAFDDYYNLIELQYSKLKKQIKKIDMTVLSKTFDKKSTSVKRDDASLLLNIATFIGALNGYIYPLKQITNYDWCDIKFVRKSLSTLKKLMETEYDGNNVIFNTDVNNKYVVKCESCQTDKDYKVKNEVEMIYNKCLYFVVLSGEISDEKVIETVITNELHGRKYKIKICNLTSGVVCEIKTKNGVDITKYILDIKYNQISDSFKMFREMSIITSDETDYRRKIEIEYGKDVAKLRTYYSVNISRKPTYNNNYSSNGNYTSINNISNITTNNNITNGNKFEFSNLMQNIDAIQALYK